jgi:probable HAF family extracellular repeat protein
MKRSMVAVLLATLLAGGCDDLTTPDASVPPDTPFQLVDSDLGDRFCTPSTTSGPWTAFSGTGGMSGTDENASEGASEIYGSNDSGWLAGRVFRNSAWRPAYKAPGADWVVLSTSGGVAFDINNQHQIVGYLQVSSGTLGRSAYLWEVGGAATLIRTAAEARAINDTGQVAGTLYSSTQPVATAFRWQGGSLTDLGAANGGPTRGYGINGHGHVVGSVNEGLAAGQAFLHDGMYRLIANPSGHGFGVGYAVSDAGEVVGQVRWTTSPFGFRGFYAIVTGGLVTNQQLVPLLPGASQNIAYAINENGNVVGRSVRAVDREWAGFMWDARTPGAEPVDLVKVAGSCGAEARTINICDQSGGFSTYPSPKQPTATSWGGCLVTAPAINLEKHTNGYDADQPTGPSITVGDPVLWEYFVTNTGNVALSDVAVTDDQGVVVTCPKTTLAIGETMTCTGSGTATAGQYYNLGLATGTYTGQTVQDTDPSHYVGTHPAGEFCPVVGPIGGIDIGRISEYLFVFTDGSSDANWQGASRGYAGSVAINGLKAKERTSGSFAYAGTIFTNRSQLDAWQGIVNNNPTQAASAVNQVARLNALEAELKARMVEINNLPVTLGFESRSATSLAGDYSGLPATRFVINVTAGFSISSKINITGRADQVFILRWDTDANPGNGYQGEVKFQSGGAIVPLGGLTPANFIHVAGDINAAGGGSTPAAPYPQGPRLDDGQGALIIGGQDFSGGGFFTGYWLTTGSPTTRDPATGLYFGNSSALSNAIFVGGWYSINNKFSMTSGTSGVHVCPSPETIRP